MAETALPNLIPQPEIHGPHGKLPILARDLKTPEKHVINALEEMRFEVETTSQVHIWMSQGQAEIFGSELSTERIYTFLKGTKLSIWSWTGCQLQIEGVADNLYKTKDSRIMTMYFNLHNSLEQHREMAVRADGAGPRVLIVGAVSSGRSNLCRVLLNYAARMRGEDRRNPLFVDLDFVQPDLAVPGTLACCQFDRPADPMYDYYYHRKFVLPYGGTSPEDNVELLHTQIRRMGDVIEKRFQNDKRAKHSGLIINAFAWVKSHGYDHVIAIAKAFKVNFIVALENEAMYNQLQHHTRREQLESDLQVVMMPKPRGVVDRSQEERRIHRETRVRINIYGHPLRSPKHVPFFHEVDFSEVTLCKLGNPTATALMLPVGSDLAKVKAAANPQQPNTHLQNHVLYVTNVDTLDKVVSEGSVIGYLVVHKVDMQARRIAFMTNFETLPKKVFLTYHSGRYLKNVWYDSENKESRKVWLRSIKGRSGKINALELKSALINGNYSSFSEGTCRLMIRMFNRDRSGTINIHEFASLWKYIGEWRTCFDRFDRDRSGTISTTELAEALNSFGYRLSPQFYQTLVKTYAVRRSNGTATLNAINFGDFIEVYVTVRNLTETFRQHDRQQQGRIQIGFEQFLDMVVQNIIWSGSTPRQA